MESAEEVSPVVIDWLERNGRDDDWFLHVNFWDPHMPARAPVDAADPFAGDLLPEWLTEEVWQSIKSTPGVLRGIEKVRPYRRYATGGSPTRSVEPGTLPPFPRNPDRFDSMDDLRMIIDGYDTGVWWMDHHIGLVLDSLERLGIAEETALVVSADHGENLGELGVFGDHVTADLITHHLPLIVSWPGAAAGSRDRGLRYHLDLGPTIAELLGVEAAAIWDGSSYAAALGVNATPRGSAAPGSGPHAARSEATRSKAGGGQSAPSWVERLDAGHDPATGWDELVLSQCAGACQRSVRFDRWLYLRTCHDGFNLYPRELLFDVEADPHECTNLSASHPDVVRDAVFRLDRWHEAMMATMAHPYAEDPLWRVIAEADPVMSAATCPLTSSGWSPAGEIATAAELRRRHPRAAQG